MVKGRFYKKSKSLKILWNWLSPKFFFAFYVFIVKFAINSHFYFRIYLIFLKNILKQNWTSFNIIFWPLWKDRKNSYIIRQVLALFCKLSALILGKNSGKRITNTKIAKKKVSLKKSEAKWNQKNVCRDNHSKNIWD